MILKVMSSDLRVIFWYEPDAEALELSHESKSGFTSEMD